MPLWSIGGAWNISDEPFYHFDKLPYLRVRVTDGYNGNVNNSLSAFTTAAYVTAVNIYGAPQASIVNPPNPNLRWEQINIQNFAIDFSSKNKRVSGSLEYYVKDGKDLIATENVDPTTGVTSFTGNFANMNGHGFDLTINSQNTIGQLKWYTNLLFSTANSEVSKYFGTPQSNATLAAQTNGTIQPLTGYPVYSIFSLRWAGLDTHGNPQGYLNGQVSENYTGILTSYNRGDLIYNGSSVPTMFGSVRNTFNWRELSLSFNIAYELGYYFRKPTTNYGSVFNSMLTQTGVYGYSDYAQRWQNPGDENKTSVPSVIYPDNSLRDGIYNYASTNIDKGDNIRLKDIQLSYSFSKSKFKKLPVQAIKLYFYANNLGILWKANKDGIDPDVVPGLNTGAAYYFPSPKTYSLGAKVDF